MRGVKNSAADVWKLIRVGAPNECWNWTGKPDKDGYGRMNVGMKKLRVHRIVYELEKGPLPEGYSACHTCDNPACCNPAHLFPGTHLENMQDRSRKGRVPHGEKHYRAKLTLEKVEQVRALRDSGLTQKEVAARFEISQVLVSCIWLNKIWRG